ncbi:RNA polymerase sigma factor [bacterium]|nr:RNA polymerase sigma factor [bacterium]
MIPSDEKTLVRRAVTGDVKAFNELLKETGGKLFSFAVSICGGNRDVAEEIYQEALVKAFINIGKFEGKSSFSTWIWTITRNSYIDFLSESRKFVSLENIESFEFPSDIPAELELIREDRAKMLRKLISELPVAYSEVITLIDLQEMDHSEAAELLGIDKNLLKVRLHRARNALEKVILANIEFFK